MGAKFRWKNYAGVCAIQAILMGCTPYIGYTHLSQPNIDDDGYDLICAGGEREKGRLRTDLAMCENIAPYGGTFFKADVKFLFKDK